MDILASTSSDLSMGLPWSKATSYFSIMPAEFNVQPMIAAVDCVTGAENKFKVYVRTQATHLSALCDMLTLGGQLQDPAVDATLTKLRDFWRALFDIRLGSCVPNVALRAVTHSVGIPM